MQNSEHLFPLCLHPKKKEKRPNVVLEYGAKITKGKEQGFVVQ
jgi:hypothetical protein